MLLTWLVELILCAFNFASSSDYDQDYEEMVKGILYETDGQVLTTEEQEFLVANATHDEYMM